MNKNSSIHSLRQKRAESAKKNQHFKNNLESLAKDIRTIEDNLHTLRETSRQKSIESTQNSLKFNKHAQRKSKSKGKKRGSKAKENVDRDDHYQMNPLERLKKKSKVYREQDGDITVLKETTKDQQGSGISSKLKSPNDILSKFHSDMISLLPQDKHNQLQSLLHQIAKLI